MVGTLTLMNMGLDPLTLKISYLANVIGSDMGSLLLPMGTLATIMWMHIVKDGGVKITWRQYMKVTFVAIPPATTLNVSPSILLGILVILTAIYKKDWRTYCE